MNVIIEFLRKVTKTKKAISDLIQNFSKNFLPDSKYLTFFRIISGHTNGIAYHN